MFHSRSSLHGSHEHGRELGDYVEPDDSLHTSNNLPAVSLHIGSDAYESGTVTRGIVPECYPSGFRSVYENGTILGTSFVFVFGSSTSRGIESTTYQSFYSPGICPLGYTTGTVQYDSSTFFATCCPSDYTLGTHTSGDPHRVTCTHTIVGDYMTLVGAGTSNQTIPYPGTAVAAAIKIAYAASDQAILVTGTDGLSSNTAASSSSVSATATPAAGSPTAPVPTQTTALAERGLSSGAQAGIGVGVSLAFILLVVGTGFFWMRSRRRRQQDRPQQVTESPFEKAELAGDSPSQAAGRHSGAELAAEDTTVHEASDEAAKPPEMDGMNVRAELPGDWVGIQAPGHEQSRDHRHEAPA